MGVGSITSMRRNASTSLGSRFKSEKEVKRGPFVHHGASQHTQSRGTPKKRAIKLHWLDGLARTATRHSTCLVFLHLLTVYGIHTDVRHGFARPNAAKEAIIGRPCRSGAEGSRAPLPRCACPEPGCRLRGR